MPTRKVTFLQMVGNIHKWFIGTIDGRQQPQTLQMVGNNYKGWQTKDSPYPQVFPFSCYLFFSTSFSLLIIRLLNPIVLFYVFNILIIQMDETLVFE